MIIVTYSPENSTTAPVAPSTIRCEDLFFKYHILAKAISQKLTKRIYEGS